MKIVLRKWLLSDAEALTKILSNGEILNNLRDGLSYPYNKKDAEDYINFIINAEPNDTFAFAIEIDGKVVGNIGAFRQGNIHRRTAELGYYLAEECHGKGIMTSAVKQLCGKLFAETDILRIFAEPFAYNIGSRRVLEKAGFRLEGIMKNNAFKNGKIFDTALYSLIKTDEQYPVRRLNEDEIPEALNLIWQVFMQFVAPEYSKEGIDEFRKSLDDKQRTRMLKFYGAFVNGTLAGVLCMRAPQHIGGFFVRSEYQGKGFGKALFEAMKKDYDKQEFTVHSSPYAVKIYERLGFVRTGEEQTINGLRFTPMKYSETTPRL